MIISLRVYEKGFIFLRTKMKKKKIEFFGNVNFKKEIAQFLDQVLLNETQHLEDIVTKANDYTMAYYGTKGLVKETVDINSKTGDYLNIPNSTRETISQFSNK